MLYCHQYHNVASVYHFLPQLAFNFGLECAGEYDSLVWWHVVPICFTSGAVVHIYTSICLPYELWLASFATLLCGSIPWEASGFQLQHHVHCYHPHAVRIDGLQALPAPIFVYGSNSFMLRAVSNNKLNKVAVRVLSPRWLLVQSNSWRLELCIITCRSSFIYLFFYLRRCAECISLHNDRRISWEWIRACLDPGC